MTRHQEDEYTMDCLEGFVDDPLDARKKHDNDDSTSWTAVQKYSETSDESDTEEDGHLFRLSEDSYSILFIAKPNSRPFRFAVVVLIMQLLVLILAVSDMERENSGNLFYPPIDVSLAVAIAQYVSLVVAGLTQVDVFISLEALIVVGYAPSITERFPGATKAKWIVSNVLRLMVGVFTFFAIFLTIVTSDNVLTIFKDFAALQFITEFDNIAFWLANFGYFGSSAKRAAKHTQQIELPRARGGKQWQSWYAITFTVFVMLFGLSFIRRRQRNGYYLLMRSAKSLTVNFGDEIYDFDKKITFDFASTSRNLTRFNETAPPVFQYAYFSGSYKINLHAFDKHDDRPIYYERGGKECRKDPTCGMFYYCQNVRAWVFTVRALNNALKEKGENRCKWGWLAQSAETAAFRLEDVPAMGWKIWTGLVTDTDTLMITNDECRQDSDCNFHGECRNDGESGRTCKCEPGWLGKKCEVEKSYCPDLMLTAYGESSMAYREIGPYELLRGKDGNALMFYNRPAYAQVSELGGCASDKFYELYLYTGRRWYVSQWCNEDPSRFFEENDYLHAYWDSILEGTTYYFSEPTTSLSGTNLAMFEVASSGSKRKNVPFAEHTPVKDSYECVDVGCQKDDAVCGAYGICTPSPDNTTSTCLCDTLFGGRLCQIDPEEPYAHNQYTSWRNGNYTESEYTNLFWENQTKELDTIKMQLAGETKFPSP